MSIKMKIEYLTFQVEIVKSSSKFKYQIVQSLIFQTILTILSQFVKTLDTIERCSDSKRGRGGQRRPPPIIPSVRIARVPSRTRVREHIE